MKIVMFTGGRGSSSITRQIFESGNELTLLVNGYDDGLSTGVTRQLAGGMLGPSDFRKTISNILNSCDQQRKKVGEMLELRLSSTETRALLRGNLSLLSKFADNIKPDHLELFEHCLETLKGENCAEIAISKSLDLSEMALGNLLFLGSYFANYRDFNKSLDFLNRLLLPEVTLLNCQDGSDLILTGIKSDGTCLRDEVSIVSPQSAARISELFLVLREDHAQLHSLNDHEYAVALRELAVTPEPCAEALECLGMADSIIYGPGTQHSSLIPSYLTRGINTAISSNEFAEKVLILNLERDHDIGSETELELVRKILTYLSGDSNIDYPAFCTKVLIDFKLFDDREISDFEAIEQTLGAVDEIRGLGLPVELGHFRKSNGKHDGESVVQSIFDRPLIGREESLSIVLPVLNERTRLPSVILELLSTEWPVPGLKVELIVVDGGSTDGTFEFASSVKGVRVVRSKGGLGNAINEGMRIARGSVCLIFPGDSEYAVADVVEPTLKVLERQANFAFCNRQSYIGDIRTRQREIYDETKWLYRLSNLGGASLSLALLLRYRRSITDVLCSVKVVRKDAYEGLAVVASGLEWHAKLARGVLKNGASFAEFPVRYYPRTRSEGKKTGFKGGLRALISLVW